MPKRRLPELPREQQRGPWPLIQVPWEERVYQPKPETPLTHRLRIAFASADLLALDLGSASLKGSFLGLFAFAVTYSFVALRVSGFCWLVGWHWQIAVGAILLLLILIGFDITVFLIAIVALWLSFREALSHPWILLLFLAGGVVTRWLIEFLPVRRSA